MVPLSESGYRKTDVEDFSHIEDLFAMILEKGISKLRKSGLLCGYEKKEEPLSTLRGKINISKSIASCVNLTGKLICEYDEWTENIYLNKILKASIFHLLKSKDVKKERKEKLRSLVSFFSKVDLISMREIKWNKLIYNRNNLTYKMLIDICKFIYDACIYTTQDGLKRRQQFDYEKILHSIYEKFLLAYYKRHFPEYTVEAPYIKWSLDDGCVGDFLPAMKSDIVIRNKDTGNTLIIDAKFYTKSMNAGKFGESAKLHSHNLYQIYTYVKNEQYHSNGRVSGVLLYAKTEESVLPNQTYSLDNNKITATALDLNKDFENIKTSLNAIIKNWQIG